MFSLPFFTRWDGSNWVAKCPDLPYVATQPTLEAIYDDVKAWMASQPPQISQFSFELKLTNLPS